jgi:hypothetical protein
MVLLSVLCTAYAVQDWFKDSGIKTAYIPPGKPWHNGLNERFDGRLRDECLNQEWFRNRREAAVVIEIFRKEYNQHPPRVGGHEGPCQGEFDVISLIGRSREGGWYAYFPIPSVAWVNVDGETAAKISAAIAIRTRRNNGVMCSRC